MTYTAHRPQVVQCPYHRLARRQYLAYHRQRQHTLINPREMDDIGLLEHRQTGDVGTAAAEINLPQVVALYMQTEQHGKPFIQEMPSLQPSAKAMAATAGVVDTDNIYVLLGLLAHKHACPHPTIVECRKQSARSNSRATRLLICVYDENFHLFNTGQSFLLQKYEKKYVTCNATCHFN